MRQREWAERTTLGKAFRLSKGGPGAIRFVNPALVGIAVDKKKIANEGGEGRVR